MLSSKILRGNSGFTLVELMVAVGITGALSAVAVPNYLKHVAKSRQSEAKIALSAIYVSEKQFGSEFGYYTACLDKTGFVAQGDRYYALGFNQTPAGLSICGPNGDKPCNAISASLDCASSHNYAYSAQMAYSGTPANDGNLAPSGYTFPSATGSGTVTAMTGVGKVAFSVGAAGSVSNSSGFDYWFINSNKTLINVKSGI
ncbi:MAG: type IV pilin protein [Bdellovibrionia bacterium]